MNTSFSEIYDLFLNKVTDYDFGLLTDEEICDYCFPILRSAIMKLPRIPDGHDLSERDNSKGEFLNVLDDYEIEIIACQMVVEWCSGKLNTTQLVNMFVGTGDESMSSQANHIKYLTELKEKNRSDVNLLVKNYGYNNYIKELGND